MEKKTLIRTISLAVTAVVLAILMIVANVVLAYYSLIINRFFAGDTADSSSAATQDALTEADKVVREAAEESIVLLKNDGLLPIVDLKKVNLFGWGSTDAGLLLTGGGSGGTTITDKLDNGKDRIKIDLTDALEECEVEYNTELLSAYKKFSEYDADYRSGGSTGADVTLSLKNPASSFYTDTLMTAAKAYSNTAIAVISRWGAENGGGGELKNIGSYSNGKFLELTNEERAMFAKLQEYGFDVIVLMNVCNNVELGFLHDFSSIKACLHIGIPGQSGMAAVPRIIKGEVNPSGRMSDILPYDYQTNDPVYAHAVKSGSDITYREGIYFGYKWYETADADGVFADIDNKYGKGYDGVVQFPFGFGLSYTDFRWEADWKNVTEFTEKGEYTVKVKVTNTGDVAGKDVVQLYGHAPYENGKIEKAERVLLDFAKTPLLEPSKSAEVELKFSAYDLASYDYDDRNGNEFYGYELESGNYELYIMKNSHEMVDYKPVKLNKDIKYETDPKTGEAVGNLFTGKTAYADCPIDGSTVGVNAQYLSRANKFANYAETQTKSSSVGNIPNYRHGNYNDKETSWYDYGHDAELYLVQVKKTEGEGEEAVSTMRRATKGELEGTDKLADNEEFVFNTELLEKLNDYDNDALWSDFLDQLTETEVKELIGMGGFMTKAIYSVGKPRCTDKDGPAGFNNNVTNAGKSSEYTLFPSESLLGCGFSKEIAYKIGAAQGKIGSSMGISGWYGPGANLHRSVYNSRNYEYFSEDPVLSGRLSAQMIVGAKENNVYCYMKHFAVSEAGQNPTNLNTWLTEQALRESYLKPFEIAVKEGEANAMMSAFNRVGAVLSGYNYALLTGVLRNEWGFRGTVITDWFSGGGYMGNHTLGVLGGNDLWLCGSTSMAANLNLNDTAVAYAARQSAKNILYTYVNTYVTATTLKVNPEASSPLFIALWVLLDVVLAAGIAVCAVFALLPVFKGRKAKAAAQAEGEAGSTEVRAESATPVEADAENGEDVDSEN